MVLTIIITSVAGAVLYAWRVLIHARDADEIYNTLTEIRRVIYIGLAAWRGAQLLFDAAALARGERTEGIQVSGPRFGRSASQVTA